MSVAQADSGTRVVESSGVTTLDLDTFTIGGSANWLVVWLHSGSISVPVFVLDPLGINQTLTNGGNTNVGGVRVQFFYGYNGATGNLKIRGSWTTASDAVIGAAAFSGVHETTPFLAADTQSGSGTTVADPETETLTIPSAANDATLAAFTADQSFAAGETQTELYRNPGIFTKIAQLTVAFGGVSNAHTAETSSVGMHWVGRGIHIQSAPAAVNPGGPSVTVYRPRLRTY